MTEAERGIQWAISGRLPPDDATEDYLAGWISWCLWSAGVPWGFEA